MRGLSHAIRAEATRAGVRADVHLHDARGYATTRFLVEFGASLAEIAAIMGWDVEYATRVVRAYARQDRSVTRRILEKINSAPVKQPVKHGAAARI